MLLDYNDGVHTGMTDGFNPAGHSNKQDEYHMERIVCHNTGSPYNGVVSGHA